MENDSKTVIFLKVYEGCKGELNIIFSADSAQDVFLGVDQYPALFFLGP